MTSFGWAHSIKENALFTLYLTERILIHNKRNVSVVYVFFMTNNLNEHIQLKSKVIRIIELHIFCGKIVLQSRFERYRCKNISFAFFWRLVFLKFSHFITFYLKKKCGVQV